MVVKFPLMAMGQFLESDRYRMFSKAFGNSFVENELFIILLITGPKRSATDLIIFRGGSKGPGALFWLIFFSRWIINSSDTCGSGRFIPLENHAFETGGHIAVRFEKKEFIVSAIWPFDIGPLVSLLNKVKPVGRFKLHICLTFLHHCFVFPIFTLSL